MEDRDRHVTATRSQTTTKVRATVHLDAALHERVRRFLEQSANNGLSLSELVSKLLTEYLRTEEKRG